MPELASLPPQLWFGLTHFLPVVVFAAMSWAVGRSLTRRLSYRDDFEAAVVSTALGWGAFGLAFFLLATAGLFSAPWVLTLLVGSQLASYRSWADLPASARRWWASRPARLRTLIAAALIAAALIIVILPLTVMPLYPPVAFDSLMYHLPMAQSIVEHQGIEFFPELRYPAFPALQETLFASGLLLTNDLTPATLHFASFLGVALLIYCWGAWLSSPRTGLLGALLWLGTFSAVVSGTAAYVDCTLTLFVSAAIFGLHRYFRRREIGWLLVSAAFAGFAAGTKYHALFFLGLLALGACAATLRHRNFRHLIWYVVVLSTTTLPWYLFIYLESGSPVHPFYPQLFGYDDWSYQMLGIQPAAISVTDGAADPTATARLLNLGKRIGSHLTSNPVSTLRLPIDIFLHPGRFGGRALSPFYLYAVALLAAMALRFRRARYAAIVVVLYLAFLMVTALDLRYVLPVLPLIAVFGAEGADRLLHWLTPASPRWIAIAITIALALPLAHRVYRIGDTQVARRGAIPVDASRRNRHIRRYVNQYRAVQFLNRHHEGDYRLYGLFAENLRYYVDGTLLGDWFGPTKYRRVIPYLRDPEGLHRVLREMEVDYLLIPNTKRWKKRKFGRIRLLRPETMQSHFRIVHRSRLSVIYSPRRHPRPIEADS